MAFLIVAILAEQLIVSITVVARYPSAVQLPLEWQLGEDAELPSLSFAQVKHVMFHLLNTKVLHFGWILLSSPPAMLLSSSSGTKLWKLLAEEPGTKATTRNLGRGFISCQDQKGKSTCSTWMANSTAWRKELIQAANIGSYTDNKLDWPFSWHHTSIKNFLAKCHFQSCSFKKKNVFIKNSWPQWSDNAAFWYQQMFCLTCSLKLYSVPSYLSFPVAICWLWDVMYVPYSDAQQFASNTTVRNELHKMLVAITLHFPNHMEHNTPKPTDTFFYYSSDP